MEYRKDLPNDMPARIAKLPTLRGYPVPWFVAEVDGTYDFRVMDYEKFVRAINHKLCWVCGEKLGTVLAFPIGPMCAVNRTISEPPSHRECAEWSIKACPFMNQSQSRRNDANMPDGAVDAAGHGIKRQPGVISLWLTNKYTVFKVPPRLVDGVEINGGHLINLGEPMQVFWYREGREATLAEIEESIDSGLPLLMEMAEKEGDRAVEHLNKQLSIARSLLPSETKSPKRNMFASQAR